MDAAAAGDEKDSAEIFCGSAPRKDDWRADCLADREARLGQGKRDCLWRLRKTTVARKIVAPKARACGYSRVAKAQLPRCAVYFESAIRRAKTAARVAGFGVWGVGAGAFENCSCGIRHVIASHTIRWGTAWKKAVRGKQQNSSDPPPSERTWIHRLLP